MSPLSAIIIPSGVLPCVGEILPLNFLPQDILERRGIGRELGDALAQLLDGHLLFVEVEAEEGLLVNIGFLLDLLAGCGLSREFLGNRLLRVEEVLEQVGADGEVIAAGELGDLSDVAEGGAHDDRLVAVFLVVVEDLLDTVHAGVLVRGEVLLQRCFVPVQNAADEGGDQVGAGFGAGDGLHEREHERQVAVDAVLRLQDARCLDAFPRRGDLDQDSVFGDADGFVELCGC